MKKRILLLIPLLILLFIIYYPTNKKIEDINTINISEVAHTPFYAPFYVAIRNGYFKNHNININLTLTPGADKVAASILSNDAQIGLAGIEADIYVYLNKNNDHLMAFSGLTNKDGSFILSREKINNFTLNDLKGKTIIGGRQGDLVKKMNNIILINI